MDELERPAASNTSEVSLDPARHPSRSAPQAEHGKAGSSIIVLIRTLIVALAPTAGLLVWHLFFAAEGGIEIGFAPVGMAAVASFLANALLPICTEWRRACCVALPSCVVAGYALATSDFGGVDAGYHDLLILFLLVYLLVVGVAVGLFGFLGAQTRALARDKPALAAIIMVIVMAAVGMLG